MSRLMSDSCTAWGAAQETKRREFDGTVGPGPLGRRATHDDEIRMQRRVAEWLVEQRRIKAIGIDTASIDHGPSSLFGAHVAFCGANIPIFENVAALDRLPDAGAFVAALPMKIAGGSGGPLRIVARVP